MRPARTRFSYLKTQRLEKGCRNTEKISEKPSKFLRIGRFDFIEIYDKIISVFCQNQAGKHTQDLTGNGSWSKRAGDIVQKMNFVRPALFRSGRMRAGS